MLGPVLENVDGITIEIDVESELDSLYGSSNFSYDIMLQGLLIRYSLGSIDGKMIGSNKEIKLGSTNGRVIGTILGNVDGITLGLQVKIELVSLDGSSDGSNDVKLERTLIVD